MVAWDGMHRDDIVRKRSFRQVPLCVEMFDVAAAMTQLFGFGVGRVIARAAAQHVQAKHKIPSSASHTRAAVSLNSSPAHLVQNFRSYHIAMHGRLDLVRQGHTSQTIDKLIGVGRRFNEPRLHFSFCSIFGFTITCRQSALARFILRLAMLMLLVVML